MVKAASIFSTLGNPNSLIPLAIKDTASTTGMTLGSYVTGKEEGHDRLIDEVGTEAIWLGGIPFYKWLFDKTIFKSTGLDAKFDPRNLKDKAILEKIKEYAPNEEIKNNIKKITNKESLFKHTATAKFIISTALTVASYIGLTKFKQNYTEKKIKQNLIDEYKAEQENKNNKNKEEKSQISPSFKGLGSQIQSLAFSPVKNMWILDGCITTERLRDSRSEQEFIGYAIKEASILTFLYYAGDKIQEIMEKRANNKFNKSIGLDARVIEDGFLKKAFEDGTIKQSLKEFNSIGNTDAELYEFIHKKPENLIVKAAKMSDIIETFKEPQGLFKKAKDTGKIDTRKYIDLNDVKNTKEKIEKLFTQFEKAISNGESSEEFFNGIKKLKRNSVLISLGSCMFALGILTPAIMLVRRFTSKDNQEFETKKRIREQLIKDGVIA